MSFRPLAALLPLDASPHQAVYVEAAQVPELGQPIQFELIGVELRLRFEGASEGFVLTLGPSEWAKIQAGRGVLHGVNLDGEVIVSYPIVLRAAA